MKRYKWYTCMVTITNNISVLVGCHIIWLTRRQSRNFTHVAGDPGQSFCAKLMDGYSSHFSGLSRLLQICIYGALLKASLVRRSSVSCARIKLRCQHPFNLDSLHYYSTVVSVQRSIAYIAGGESFTMWSTQGVHLSPFGHPTNLNRPGV